LDYDQTERRFVGERGLYKNGSAAATATYAKIDLVSDSAKALQVQISTTTKTTDEGEKIPTHRILINPAFSRNSKRKQKQQL
jgi:hypothetical protein